MSVGGAGMGGPGSGAGTQQANFIQCCKYLESSDLPKQAQKGEHGIMSGTGNKQQILKRKEAERPMHMA
eukprot:12516963-Ditylum_brightwellii.AAC.1